MEGFEQSVTATLKLIEGACIDVRKLEPTQARPEDFAALHSKINGLVAALSACELASAPLDFEVALASIESIDSSPPGDPNAVVKAADERYSRARESAVTAQQQLSAELDRIDPNAPNTAQPAPADASASAAE